MAVKGSAGNLVLSIDDFISSNIRDDGKRDDGLTTPDDIERFDNIRYGTHPRHLLDVYRPKYNSKTLPVIVSIHGGGWVYGNKELMQFYCMSLAQRGFVVINFSYRIAPEHKHPAPFEDANEVFKWVLAHADQYGMDINNIFGVGDSCGANTLGLYACMCNDSEFAKRMGILPPNGLKLRALGLNSGLFYMARGEVDVLMDNLASAYFPEGGTDVEYQDICLKNHVDGSFPPCFIMTALGDFLLPQSKPFYELLTSLGVDAELHVYGKEGNELRHVFHVDMKLPESKISNDDECLFFLRRMERANKMAQYDRMQAGLIYDTTDPEIMKMQQVYQVKLWEFNQLGPADGNKKRQYMKEVFAECGDKCYIELPFHASWGGHHVHFGSGIYANFNLTIVDDGNVYVGDRVLFGPNVVIATSNHPLNAKLRRQEMQYVRDVHIGENVWIGAGAIILPGVTIGKNTVIGAGSIVTRDIPEQVLAVGNPCRVIRKIDEHDDEFYRADDKIDWENINELNMLYKRGIFE